jgi:hypothetical protein
MVIIVHVMLISSYLGHLPVIFQCGHLPDFQNSENCFELYSYTSITNVITNVFDLKLF